MAEAQSLADWACQKVEHLASQASYPLITGICQAADHSEEDPLADLGPNEVLRKCEVGGGDTVEAGDAAAENKTEEGHLVPLIQRWASTLGVSILDKPLAGRIAVIADSADESESLALALLLVLASPSVRAKIAGVLATGTPASEEPSNQDDAASAGSSRPAKTDRYGFFFHESETNVVRVETQAEKRQRLQLENLRAEKWRGMCNNWERWRKHKADKVKKRIRKGIPDSIRGFVWPRLVHALEMDVEKPYAHYVEEARLNPDQETKPGGVIDRDLDRTFPRCQLFADRGGLGQTQLRNVLIAFAAYRPDVGYFQGMNFFTALFLSFVPEDIAFAMLCRIVLGQPHNMQEFFSTRRGSICCLHHQLRGLLRAKLPRLHRHFEEQGIDVAFFSTEWFVTVYSRSFPFGFVVHVWDIFLNEGWKIVFRVALTILKSNQSKLLQLDMEGIMLFFRHLLTHIDVDTLVERSLKFKLKTRELEALAEDWGSSKNP